MAVPVGKSSPSANYRLPDTGLLLYHENEEGESCNGFDVNVPDYNYVEDAGPRYAGWMLAINSASVALSRGYIAREDLSALRESHGRSFSKST